MIHPIPLPLRLPLAAGRRSNLQPANLMSYRGADRKLLINTEFVSINHSAVITR